MKLPALSHGVLHTTGSNRLIYSKSALSMFRFFSPVNVFDIGESCRKYALLKKLTDLHNCVNTSLLASLLQSSF